MTGFPRALVANEGAYRERHPIMQKKVSNAELGRLRGKLHIIALVNIQRSPVGVTGGFISQKHIGRVLIGCQRSYRDHLPTSQHKKSSA